MGLRVLIVEDNEDDREVYASVIGHAGYDVMVSEDGVSGLMDAVEFRPVLAILDVGLPGMSGWDICTVLKAREATRDIKILFLTAFTDPEDERKAYEVGADAYIRKPAEPARIIGEIQELIGRP